MRGRQPRVALPIGPHRCTIRLELCELTHRADRPLPNRDEHLLADVELLRANPTQPNASASDTASIPSTRCRFRNPLASRSALSTNQTIGGTAAASHSRRSMTTHGMVLVRCVARCTFALHAACHIALPERATLHIVCHMSLTLNAKPAGTPHACVRVSRAHARGASWFVCMRVCARIQTILRATRWLRRVRPCVRACVRTHI